MGLAMTTKGTILKLGAFSAVIRETRLLWVTVTEAKKGVPSPVPAALGLQLWPGDDRGRKDPSTPGC